MSEHVLEPAAREIAEATAEPPFLFELGPDGARKVLDDVQAPPIDKPDVDERWVTVSAQDTDSSREFADGPSVTAKGTTP
jgi:acetyl esterase